MKIFPEDYKKFKILILALSSIPILIHLYTNLFAGYGYFRDELYYIACANHLNMGYVDHPPLSIFILKVWTFIFGRSLFSIRFLPAVISGLVVFLTCMMTLKMGGGKKAIIIASAAAIFAPFYLGVNSIYSMNTFDILLWAIAYYVIILIIENDDKRLWYILGVVFGLGLLNKVGFLWLCFGFFAGLLLTDKRKVYLTIKPYLCALIAFIIFSPFIIWNFQNDFAHLEFIKNATSGKYSGISRMDFALGQIGSMNPFSLLVWLPGLYYLFFNESGKKFKLCGIIFVISFLVLIGNGHSKPEYLASAYTVLFAAGGVFIGKISSLKFKYLSYAVAILITVFGLLILPLAVPLLPVKDYIAYSKKIGNEPGSSENKELSELPQFYADMFGWEELASNVSIVYMTLSEDEKKRAVFFANNYGEASAINLFSKDYKLPKAISGHNSYWLWGYDKIDDPVVIILGGNKEELLNIFDFVQEIIIHKAEYSMPYENNLPIFVARKMKTPLDSIWIKNKHYE